MPWTGGTLAYLLSLGGAVRRGVLLLVGSPIRLARASGFPLQGPRHKPLQAWACGASRQPPNIPLQCGGNQEAEMAQGLKRAELPNRLGASGRAALDQDLLAVQPQGMSVKQYSGAE